MAVRDQVWFPGGFRVVLLIFHHELVVPVMTMFYGWVAPVPLGETRKDPLEELSDPRLHPWLCVSDGYWMLIGWCHVPWVDGWSIVGVASCGNWLNGSMLGHNCRNISWFHLIRMFAKTSKSWVWISNQKQSVVSCHRFHRSFTAASWLSQFIHKYS